MNASGDGGRKLVDVAWAATSPESGRFSALVTRSNLAALNDRFVALRERGEGYLEVRRNTDYPALTMGFRGSVAVVEAMVSEGAMSILVGDGSCPADVVKIPIMEEDAVFSGPAGIDVDRAWSLVQGFLRGRDLTELGEWFEL